MRHWTTLFVLAFHNIAVLCPNLRPLLVVPTSSYFLVVVHYRLPPIALTTRFPLDWLSSGLRGGHFKSEIPRSSKKFWELSGTCTLHLSCWKMKSSPIMSLKTGRAQFWRNCWFTVEVTRPSIFSPKFFLEEKAFPRPWCPAPTLAVVLI